MHNTIAPVPFESPARLPFPDRSRARRGGGCQLRHRCRLVWVMAILLTGWALPATSRAASTVVLMKTSMGDIHIELYDDKAPNTVANFLKYVNAKFFDGLVFHRIINGFMVQGGAYDDDLYDANFTASNFNLKNPVFYHTPNAAINLEVTAGLKNLRGTLAMARTTELNSATSQFFINVADNPHLDPNTATPYAVFGKVTRGMDVVDAMVQKRVTEGNFTAAATHFPDLPKNPITIQSMSVFRVFEASSADLSTVPYFKAKNGTIRLFRGQGSLRGAVMRHEFTAATLLDPPVSCLKWTQSATAAQAMDTVSLTLAKDKNKGLWLVRHVLNEGRVNEEILADANSVMDLVSLTGLAGQSIYYRLMLGLTDANDLEDPTNQIAIGEGAAAYRETILDFDATLTPDFPGDLVTVRKSTGLPESAAITGWSYYDPNDGLALELLDGIQDTANGNGWRLSHPGTLPGAVISLTADRRDPNTTPTDSFLVTGGLNAQAENFASGFIFIRAGVWETTIDTASPALKPTSSGYRYQTTSQTGEKIDLKFDLKRGKFTFYVKNTNLTGLTEPVALEMVAGAFSATGTAKVRGGGGKVPLRLLYGKQDKLLSVKYKRVYDTGPRNDYLMLWGQIAADEGTLNLNPVKLTATWNSKTYTIALKQFQALGGGRYLYANSGNAFKYALFDWSRGEYKIVLKGSGIAGPTKNLTLLMQNSANTALFNQTVEVKAN